MKGNLPHVLINLANAKSKQGIADEAQHYFSAAIVASGDLGDIPSAAAAWSELGYHHLKRGELTAADHAYVRAFYLRKTAHINGLAGSYRDLGMMRLAQGEQNSAIRLLEAGLSIAKLQSIGFPVLILY